MNVGVRDLRNGLSRYLAAVREGSEITVTDHGTPMARLVPVGAESGLEQFLGAAVAREIRRRAEMTGIRPEDLLAELAEIGLAHSERVAPTLRNGIPVMAGASGHVISDELVAEYRDDL